MYGYLYREKWGLKQLPDDGDSFQTLTLMQKTCIFFNVSGTLHAHGRLCLRVHVEGFLGFIFPKKIYLLIKGYIFHFNISQFNLISN